MTVQASPIRNVLFIMCDQLRWDAISCSGHSVIETPNIDRLAGRGVRFDRAYAQGAVCGSSRMSFYTGRYVQSHGARWNRVPLSIGQRTLGDHLRPYGLRTVLVGKTHHAPDRDSLAHLGLDPDAPENVYLMQCGFEGTERDDGLHPDQRNPFDLPYNRFLRANGFDVPNPWHTAANSVTDEAGNVVSGWLLRSSAYPAIVPNELSETAYMVDRAISFMSESGDDPWCMHLSFIKPHWPYVVSEPYHQLVHPNDLPATVRHDEERANEHPVLNAFQRSRIGSCFSRDEVRQTVYPAYLGLVKQIDDHLGRLFAALDAQGKTDETMIVFTADHGDYMGDHWMGEKDWFHDQSVKIPFIMVDPRPEADATRGSVSDQLVEAIDLAPTLVEAIGGDPSDLAHATWLEGRSLIPTLHESAETQLAASDEANFAETDFGYLEMSNHLPAGTTPEQMRATMVRTDRYKYILSEVGPNLLYDLHDDPDEFHDRAADPSLATVQAELHERLFAWYRQRDNTSTTVEPMRAASATPGDTANDGIVIGFWDEEELAAGLDGKLF